MRAVRAVLSIVVGFFVFASFSVVNATEYPGSIPGSFGVSDQGVAQYSIPIAAPAATGGLQPNLALTYNHLAGNGLAGMRWTLSGFSSITRCHLTYAQDGEVEAISYGSDDRFCLDGQRLVGTSGTYGADNSEYRTEIETFQRIKSSTTSGNEPDYFIVEHGDGSKSYYGYTSDSRVNAVGISGKSRLWYISHTTDQFGNTISYSYDEDTSTGEVLPEEVAWTSNATASPSLTSKYKIVITYENRPASEQMSGYTPGGAEIERSQRINYIRVLYNTSTEIAEYDLTYSTGTSGLSQLDEVTLCRGTDCLPETAFTWQDSIAGWNARASTGRSVGDNTLIGDFNNDGHMDVFVYLSGSWRVYRGNGSGGLEAAINSGVSSTNPGTARVIDYNGDGKSDLLYMASGNYWHVMTSTGTGFNTPVNTGQFTAYDTQSTVLDFDGDGLDDWLYYYDSDVELKWRRNTGGSFNSPVAVYDYVYSMGESYPVLWPNYRGPDVNADGRGDIITNAPACWGPPPGGCMVGSGYAYATGSDYYLMPYYTSAFESARVIDINGDGMDDLLIQQQGSSTIKLAMNEGGELAATPVNTTITDADFEHSIVTDYNHDGFGDLLRYSSGTGRYYVHLSDGTALDTSPTTNFVSEPGIGADIDGDGFLDILSDVSGTWYVATNKTPLPDVVTDFEDGLGYGVSVTYESLPQTASDHYVVDSGDVPSSDVQQQYSGARYVVTHEYHDNGIGGTREIRHKYDTAWLDRSGRGWLSFDNHTVTDVAAETNSYRELRQDFPYAGMPSKTQLRRTSNSQVITEAVQSWSKTTNSTPTPDIHFVRVESTTSKEWEIGGLDNGDLIRTVVDDPTYNTTYGYVTSREVATTDPTSTYTWTTTNTITGFTNNSTYWCLGLPGTVTTENEKPDTSSASRVIYSNWNSDCSLNYTVDQTEASNADRLKTSYDYDDFGNAIEVATNNVSSTAQAREVDYDFDTTGQFVESETLATVNLETTRTWDWVNGQPATETAADGLTTVTYGYDAFGRPASVDTSVSGASTDYTYSSNCSGIWCPTNTVYYVLAEGSDGSENYEFFDALNRPVGKAWLLAGGDQAREQTVYNSEGQIEEQSRPYVAGDTVYWVEYDYDLIGRVIEEDAPVSESLTSGAITTTAYLGETVQVTDAENNVTKTEHNAIGQVIKVTDANSKYATYTYTPFGDLATMTDAEFNTTTIGYDPRGFKASMDDPNMGDWEYEYNIYGELVSQTNALDQETTLEYDEAGRLVERDEPADSVITTWTYNGSGASAGARGKLSNVEIEQSSSTIYEEDYSYYTSAASSGEKAQVSWISRTFDGTAHTFYMDYDSQGRLDVLTYPQSTSGYTFKADYDYDAYGHLKYVKDGNEAYTYYTLNETDALGRATSVSLGNSRTTTTDYDEAAGYLMSIATTGAVQSLSFTYDEVGNVLTRADGLISETETFLYDELNRLEYSTVSGEGTVTMVYSDAGRIESKTGVGSYTYGAGSAGPFAVTSANGLSYTYDANGRMITRGSDDITWTAFDKPKKIESGSDYTEFRYGPDRARYRQDRHEGGNTTVIRYVGNLFEFEDPASGNDLYRHYVQAGDQVIAIVEREDSGSPSNVKKYLHRDNQGSVTKVTNSSGTVIESLAFDAWGVRRDPTDWSDLASPFAGSHETERGYTGHEHLDTVGLIHMNGRVQDPVLGRFISADPLIQEPYHTQSHNRYSYVWNNPSSKIDPSGFCALSDGYSDCTNDQIDDFSKRELRRAEREITSWYNELHDLNRVGSTGRRHEELMGSLRNAETMIVWLWEAGRLPDYVLSGAEPDFEPERWNDGINGIVQSSSNCLAYAVNRPNPYGDGEFGFDPGLGHPGGTGLVPGQEYSFNEYRDRLIADGLSPVPLEGYYPVYFIRMSETGFENRPSDYHVMRRDSNGSWSHKLGTQSVGPQGALEDLIASPGVQNMGTISQGGMLWMQGQ